MLPIPFHTTDWQQIPPATHPGAQGIATWRTIVYNNLRIRLVEYSPGISPTTGANSVILSFVSKDQ